MLAPLPQCLDLVLVSVLLVLAPLVPVKVLQALRLLMMIVQQILVLMMLVPLNLKLPDHGAILLAIQT
jgi:hypothetical protein